MSSTPYSASEGASTVVGSAPRPRSRSAPRVGSTLGRYLVIEELGRGAMGMVLRGYDPKLQREVALKVLHTNAMSTESHARIIREARAMAQLSHPNVVAVYDVEGGDDDRVILAMEFVEGGTLGRWLEDEHPWAEVLAKFVAAGRGLAAAHAVGLLHRDFKPPNVLVGQRVMVTDFGLARAVGSGPDTMAGSDSTSGPEPGGSFSQELTAVGQVVGTPIYMAPEQHAGEELTPAVDQYAFCVSLWRGLTGSLPYSIKGKTLIDLVNAKLRGPPPWPRGGSVPRAVVAAVRRGLAPSPEERWPAMQPLLDALDQATHRRTRAMVGVGLGLAAAAAGGAWVLAGTGERPCMGASALIDDAWGPTRRAEAEAAVRATTLPYAVASWERISGQLDDYAADWRDQHTQACEATVVRGEQSAEIMDTRMACLQRARTTLDATAELLARADAQVVEKGDRLVEGLPPLGRCEDIEALLAAVPPPLPQEAEAVEVARAGMARAAALIETVKVDEAEAAIAEARAALEGIAYEPIQAELELLRGRVLEGRGDYEGAIVHTKAALRRALRLGQWPEAFAAARSLVFVVGFKIGRTEEALAYADLGWGLMARTGLPPGVAEVRLRNNIANTLSVAGRLGDAEQELRKSIELYQAHDDGAGSGRGTGMLRLNLARVLQQQGRSTEAEAEARLSIQELHRALGPDHPSCATALTNVALALYGQGRHLEAEQQLRESLALSVAAYGEEHPDVARVRINLSLVLTAQEKLGEAEEENRVALEALERVLPAGHADLAGIRHNRSLLLGHLERYEEAEAAMARSIEDMAAAKGAEFHGVALFRTNYGKLLFEDLGRHEEGLAQLREAMRIYESTFEPDNPTLASARVSVAAALLDLSRHAEAVPLLELAWGVLEEGAENDAQQVLCARALADALWSSGGDQGRARALAQGALSVAHKAGPDFAEDVELLQQWLAEHPE